MCHIIHSYICQRHIMHSYICQRQSFTGVCLLHMIRDMTQLSATIYMDLIMGVGCICGSMGRNCQIEGQADLANRDHVFQILVCFLRRMISFVTWNFKREALYFFIVTTNNTGNIHLMTILKNLFNGCLRKLLGTYSSTLSKCQMSNTRT